MAALTAPVRTHRLAVGAPGDDVVPARPTGRHAAGRPAPAGHAGVVVTDLVKTYPGGRAPALDGLSVDVAPGEVLGLLGPNGAGKSTTVGIVTTRVRPTSGRVSVGGCDALEDPSGVRARLAVVPQHPTLDRSLSVLRNLTFSARYRGVPRRVAAERAVALLDRLGLGDRAGDRVDRLSGGQAQRVMVARSLMTAPSVLLLDEPTTGLDPAARHFIWDLVGDLRRAGLAVLVTTHDMVEATRLCDRVAVMDRGRTLALDSPERLVAGLPRADTIDLTVAGCADPTGLAAELLALDGVQAVDPLPDPGPGSDAAGGPTRLRVRTGDAPAPLIPAAATRVAALGGRLVDVHLGRADLEDVFFALTGRELR